MLRIPMRRALLVWLPALAAASVAAACGGGERAEGPLASPGAVTATRMPAAGAAAATPTPSRAATAAATPTSVQAPAPARGGALKIAQGADPTSCDLHTARASGYVSVHACNPMLSQLVRAPSHDYSLMEPDLAESWKLSSDGTLWEFRLRAGARWHDGTPVTANDLRFSLTRIIAPPPSLQIGRAGALARYVGESEQVVVPDSATVTVRTDYPAASFLPTLASVYVSMYPETPVRKLDPPSMVAFMSVVGSGPFKAAGAVRGTSYRMTRFDAYYEPGLPYLDEVQFLIIPEPAVRMAALRSHAADTIAIVTDPEAESIERDFSGRITVYTSPSAGGSTVQMNVNRAPFDNPKVRRAVNLAISRDEANIALGKGLAGAVMPPGSRWAMDSASAMLLAGYGSKQAPGLSNPDLSDEVTNRSEAKRLLNEAGLGSGFDVKVLVRADPFAQTLAEFAAAQVRLVGIMAEVVPVEPGAYQDIVVRRDFAMIAHSHSFASDDPDVVLYDNYSCKGSENYPGLCDPVIEDLLQKQSRELDTTRRKAIVNELEKRIWEADAKVWFQWTIRRSPVWSNVHGLAPGGPSFYQGRRLERVWVEP